MSCSIAPTPRSCISSSREAEAAAHQQRDDADVHGVHRRLVAGALGEHADAEVLLADHLVDQRARQRLGLGARLAAAWRRPARASAGRRAPPRRTGASQRCSASRWRVETLLPGMRGSSAESAPARAGTGSVGGSTTVSSAGSVVGDGVDGVGAAEAPSASLAAAPGRSASRPRSSPAPSSRREVAVLRAPAHRCAGRASGSSPAAPAVVMRKLLSGNGCDIQPMSRWTNIPTRSAWTSISGVMVLVAAFMGWSPRRRTADGASGVIGVPAPALSRPCRGVGAARRNP